MMPNHAARGNFAPHSVDAKGLKFVIFDQRDNDRRAPRADNVEIKAEIAIPGASESSKLLFARAERNTDAAPPSLSTLRRSGADGSGLF